MVSSGTPSLVQKFRVESEQMCSLLEKEGLVLRPYKLDTLPYFQQLDLSGQQEVVGNIERYNRICQSVYADGKSLKDSLFFLSKALTDYGFDHDPLPALELRDSDVLEIYNLKNLQLFRNLNFFEYASYTVEDIYCRPWTHLYHRDPAVTEKLIRAIEPMWRGVTAPILVDVDEHVLYERASLERLKVYIKVLWAVPLTKDGKIEGYISAERCRPYQEH